MSDTVQERSKVKLRPIKLSDELLSELCSLLDAEFADMIDKDKDSYASIKYHSEGKYKDYTTVDSKAFLKNGIQKDLEHIRLWLYGKHKEIEIKLYVTSLLDPEFEVSGRDATWVAGITRRLEEILVKYKTNNQVFHSRSTAAPIAIMLDAALIAIILFTLRLFYQISDSTIAYIVAIGAGSSFWGMWALLAWLYPKIETKHMTRVNARKKMQAGITAGVGAIVLTIIGNYIWQLLNQ